MKAVLVTAGAAVIATVVGIIATAEPAYVSGVADVAIVVQSSADIVGVADKNVQSTHNDAVESLIDEAVKLASADGDPVPSADVIAQTRVVYRELMAGGLDASDITHDALGGIAITIGDAGAYAWVSLRNDVPHTVRFLGERAGGPPIPVGNGYVSKIAEHVRNDGPA